MILSVIVPTGAAGKAYEHAATTLLCDCGCHPQSIKACACGHAEDLRVALAADASSGKTGEEIVAGYVAKHGQKILVSPPATGFNLIAWTGPAIGLVGAALMIAFMLRRWRRTSDDPAHDALSPTPQADDAYVARLRKELEESR